MPDIVHEIAISAAPERVYAALTTPEGIAGWWTTECNMTPEVSSTAEFIFGDKYHNEMRVSILDPSRRVEFACLLGDQEWIGTRLCFDLRPHKDGTTLSFGHRDWKERTEFFASCDKHWAHYMTSLKDYVETGQGTPHQQRQF